MKVRVAGKVGTRGTKEGPKAVRELSQLQSGTVWDARMASGLSILAEPVTTLIVCDFYHSSARLIHVYEHTHTTTYSAGTHL